MTTRLHGIRKFSVAAVLSLAVLGTGPLAAFGQTIEPITLQHVDPYWIVTEPGQTAHPEFVAIGMEMQQTQGITAAEAETQLTQAGNQLVAFGAYISPDLLASVVNVPAPTEAQIDMVRAELQAAGSNVA